MIDEQIELFDIPSPCKGICQSNKKGYCFGCLRSRLERQHWFEMSNEQRREVIRLINGRRQRLERMRRRQKEQLELDLAEQVTPELF